MLYERVEDFPHPFFDDVEGPFLSLCLPTRRGLADNDKDAIHFKNLLKVLRDGLKKHDVKERDSLIAPLEAMLEDRGIFKNARDGLCAYAAQGRAIYYVVSVEPLPHAEIGDRFRITPLLRHFGAKKDYHALTVSRSSFSLYRGDMDLLDRVILPENVKTTMTEVLGEETTQNTLVHASYGGTSQAMVHGHSDRKEEIDKDTKRFFTHVDKVATSVSKKARIPMVLVALPEHQSFFKSHTKNSYLLTEGVKKSPAGMDDKSLQSHLEKRMETYRGELLDELVETFEKSRARGQAEQDPQTIVKAALGGRVRTLMIEAGRRIPGTVDKESGRITYAQGDDERSDILDDIALKVHEQGGEVVVIDKARFPTDSAMAAILRY